MTGSPTVPYKDTEMSQEDFQQGNDIGFALFSFLFFLKIKV